MNDGASEVAAAKSSTTSLAFACIMVWEIAASSTGPLGIWLAIGGAAVGLGVAVWVLAPGAVRGLLQPSPRLLEPPVKTARTAA